MSDKYAIAMQVGLDEWDKLKEMVELLEDVIYVNDSLQSEIAEKLREVLESAEPIQKDDWL